MTDSTVTVYITILVLTTSLLFLSKKINLLIPNIGNENSK